MFHRSEWVGLILLAVIIIAFGVNLESRTALRRVPRTDLGVFAEASAAVWAGENVYNVTDWHGWHYQYAPTLAILFLPFAETIDQHPSGLGGGDSNRILPAWAYRATKQNTYVGLHQENARFFRTVALWYGLSVVFVIVSLQTLACALEGRAFSEGPPVEKGPRRRWWMLRLVPLVVCIGSIGTDFSRGQVDVLMLVAVCVGIYCASKAKDVAAGMWFSFPATVKLFPPFLLLYPLWRRRWRMVAGMIAGLILALIVLPVVVLGPSRTLGLYKTWTEVLAKPALGEGSDTSRLAELTGMGSTDNQSLLAVIHEWRFHGVARGQRPAVPEPWERYTVYAVGFVMLIGIATACGRRRDDSPRALLIIAGLLIGLAFVVSPVVHNFYYLMMLPLVSALLDDAFSDGMGGALPWRRLAPVAAFMFVDLLSRMPGVGPVLRDCGAPLFSLLYLMAAGVAVLRKRTKLPTPAARVCCEVHA